jgi:hypothetical protein
MFNFFEVHHLQGLLQRDYPEQWLEHPGTSEKLKIRIGINPGQRFPPQNYKSPFQDGPGNVQEYQEIHQNLS